MQTLTCGTVPSTPAHGVSEYNTDIPGRGVAGHGELGKDSEGPSQKDHSSEFVSQAVPESSVSPAS